MTTSAGPVVGVVSPGAMGSALGDALARGGAHVVATLAGRSERTRGFAERAQINVLPDLAAVVHEAAIVLSVVPPGAAEQVVAALTDAAQAADARPLIADLNAVSPTTARRLAETTTAAGCDLVDGSVSGPPPWNAQTTRLYLSGPQAVHVAALPFEGVERIVVGAHVGSASAVKMSTASVYKGGTALLMQALLSAHANGVLEHVLGDLRTAAPELVSNVERRLASAAAKSERYVDEMQEIAATQAAAGLTPALFEAMAEIYARASESELSRANPEDVEPGSALSEILDALRR